MTTATEIKTAPALNSATIRLLDKMTRPIIERLWNADTAPRRALNAALQIANAMDFGDVGCIADAREKAATAASAANIDAYYGGVSDPRTIAAGMAHNIAQAARSISLAATCTTIVAAQCADDAIAKSVAVIDAIARIRGAGA